MVIDVRIETHTRSKMHSEDNKKHHIFIVKFSRSFKQFLK